MLNTRDNTSLVDKASFVTSSHSILLGVVISCLTILTLYLLMVYNYQLFHTIAELLRVVVALSMFLFTWNSRKLWDNVYLLSVGMAFPFVGLFDLLHLMTYEGMGVINAENPLSMSLQYYLMARFLEGMAFLLPLVIYKYMQKPVQVVSGYAIIAAIWILSVSVWNVIPAFYYPELGQTALKYAFQWSIVILFALVIYTYIKKRKDFEIGIWIRLMLAFSFTIVSEFSHSLDINFRGFSVVTHVLSIISYYFIYRAIIVTGIEEPFNVVFHNLKRSEREKDLLVSDLRQALDEVKTLSGFIPICINCKKIRDDEGYWQQVEEYIRNRSNAEFSHAICPDCMEKLYPDYKDTSSGTNEKSGTKTSHRH